MIIIEKRKEILLLLYVLSAIENCTLSGLPGFEVMFINRFVLIFQVKMFWKYNFSSSAQIETLLQKEVSQCLVA